MTKPGRLRPSYASRLRPRKVFEAVLVLFFLGGLFVPLSMQVIVGGASVLAVEKRMAAPPPALPGGNRSIGAFIEDLDRYLRDNFGLRQWLLTRYHYVRFRLFGDYNTGGAQVLVGRQGWLFLNRDRQIDGYRGAFQLSEKHWKALGDKYQLARDELELIGIPYLLVIAPNKQSIYPEFLPAWAQTKRGPSFTDQFLDYMRQHHPRVQVLDLRPPLIAAKPFARLYGVTDAHWMQTGGYFAAQAIVAHLRATALPDLEPTPPLSSFRVVARKGVGGDLTAMMNIRPLMHEVELALQPSRPFAAAPVADSAWMSLPTLSPDHPTFVYKREDLPAHRIVVYRNSFFTALAPFLADSFREMIVFWRPDVDIEVVKSAGPDLVIQQILEMQLGEP